MPSTYMRRLPSATQVVECNVVVQFSQCIERDWFCFRQVQAFSRGPLSWNQVRPLLALSGHIETSLRMSAFGGEADMHYREAATSSAAIEPLAAAIAIFAKMSRSQNFAFAMLSNGGPPFSVSTDHDSARLVIGAARESPWGTLSRPWGFSFGKSRNQSRAARQKLAWRRPVRAPTKL
jgi:hypothetical protein